MIGCVPELLPGVRERIRIGGNYPNLPIKNKIGQLIAYSLSHFSTFHLFILTLYLLLHPVVLYLALLILIAITGRRPSFIDVQLMCSLFYYYPS